MLFPRTVYAIQHNVTKRMYIGSSAKVEERIRNHIFALRAGKHPVEDMQKDFNDYGEDYSYLMLDEIQTFDEKAKEYEWMKKCNSYNRNTGYNYKDHTAKKGA